MTESIYISVVDDDESLRESLEGLLKSLDFFKSKTAIPA